MKFNLQKKYKNTDSLKIMLFNEHNQSPARYITIADYFNGKIAAQK